MLTKFVADSRQVVAGAREIASALDSPTLEAEHLLLAVASRRATTAQRVLVEAGLDYDRVLDALDAEFEASLAAGGVALSDCSPQAAGATSRVPRWGTSAKLALERSARIADARGDRRITPGHIVLGVLRASRGTVPRALDGAGIDRADLGRRVAAAL